MKTFSDFLAESDWSEKVKPKWHPEPDFFDRSGEEIAKGLLSASDSTDQAMERLNFYINRAGKDLSPGDRARLDSAKSKLSDKK